MDLFLNPRIEFDIIHIKKMDDMSYDAVGLDLKAELLIMKHYSNWNRVTSGTL